MSKAKQLPNNVCYATHVASVYEFYLSGTIHAPEHYKDWFNVIRNASAADSVVIYINSSGGNLDTALQFTRVLSETEAHITCSVEGSCMSAATIVFLQADSYQVTDHSLFMFHNYSSGMFGKGGELYDQAVFERAWSKKFLNTVYKDFLRQEEIDSILDNKDLWLDSDEVALRLEIRQEEREKQEEAKE